MRTASEVGMTSGRQTVVDDINKRLEQIASELAYLIDSIHVLANSLVGITNDTNSTSGKPSPQPVIYSLPDYVSRVEERIIHLKAELARVIS